MGERELVALLNLSSWCFVVVVWLFLAVPWVHACMIEFMIFYAFVGVLLCLHLRKKNVNFRKENTNM